MVGTPRRRGRARTSPAARRPGARRCCADPGCLRQRAGLGELVDQPLELWAVFPVEPSLEPEFPVAAVAQSELPSGGRRIVVAGFGAVRIEVRQHVPAEFGKVGGAERAGMPREVGLHLRPLRDSSGGGHRVHDLGDDPSVRRADLPRRQRGRRLGQLRGQRLTGQCPTRAEFGGLFRPQPGLGPGQVYQLAHQCRGAAEPGLCHQPARVDLGERVEHHRMHHPRRAFNSTNEIEYRTVVQSGQRRTHLVRAGGNHLYRRVSVASRAYSRNHPRQSAGPPEAPRKGHRVVRRTVGSHDELRHVSLSALRAAGSSVRHPASCRSPARGTR